MHELYQGWFTNVKCSVKSRYDLDVVACLTWYLCKIVALNAKTAFLCSMKAVILLWCCNKWICYSSQLESHCNEKAGATFTYLDPSHLDWNNKLQRKCLRRSRHKVCSIVCYNCRTSNIVQHCQTHVLSFNARAFTYTLRMKNYVQYGFLCKNTKF